MCPVVANCSWWCLQWVLYFVGIWASASHLCIQAPRKTEIRVLLLREPLSSRPVQWGEEVPYTCWVPVANECIVASPSRNVSKKELHPLLAHIIRLGIWKTVRTCLLNDRDVSGLQKSSSLPALFCRCGNWGPGEGRSVLRVGSADQKLVLLHIISLFHHEYFSLHMLIIDPSLPLSHMSQDHYSEFWRLVFIDQLLSGTHLAFLQIHLYTFLAKFL